MKEITIVGLGPGDYKQLSQSPRNNENADTLVWDRNTLLQSVLENQALALHAAMIYMKAVNPLMRLMSR